MLLLFVKNISQLLSQNIDINQLALRGIGLQALKKSILAVKPNHLIEESVKLHNNKLFIENDEYDLKKFTKYGRTGDYSTCSLADFRLYIQSEGSVP